MGFMARQKTKFARIRAEGYADGIDHAVRRLREMAEKRNEKFRMLTQRPLTEAADDLEHETKEGRGILTESPL